MMVTLCSLKIILLLPLVQTLTIPDPLRTSKITRCQLPKTLTATIINGLSNKSQLSDLFLKELDEPSLELNGNYRLECGGEGNYMKYFGRKEIDVLCTPNGLQTEFGLIVNFESLACIKVPDERTSSVVRSGTCSNGKCTKANIVLSEWNGATFIETCHDETRSETIYAFSHIDGPHLSESETTTRPSFKEADFYPNIDANWCYTQAQQTKTIAKLLGSDELANKLIIPNQNLHLSRGHLTPNADGIKSYEKLATFYYINAAPQWQCNNAGNWERLENAMRVYAQSKSVVLSVYTGTSGVMTLKNDNGVDVKIYLGKTSEENLIGTLPVPRFMWKTVYDPVSNRAIGMYLINNPYVENHTAEDRKLCKSICSQLTWVTWDCTNPVNGYMVCCDITEFYTAFDQAPKFPGYPSLLDY